MYSEQSMHTFAVSALCILTPFILAALFERDKFTATVCITSPSCQLHLHKWKRYSVQCTVYSVQCTVYSAQLTENSCQCVQRSEYSAWCAENCFSVCVFRVMNSHKLKVFSL